MSIITHIPKTEVFGIFEKNRERLRSQMVLVAENADTKYAIYLTAEGDIAWLTVCRGNAPPECSEPVFSSWDAERAVTSMCRDWLGDEGEDERESGEDMSDEQYMREDELRMAVLDFLETALRSDDARSIPDEIADEILDRFLEILAYEYEFPIFRPTPVIDADGEETYIEHPYE